MANQTFFILLAFVIVMMTFSRCVKRRGTHHCSVVSIVPIEVEIGSGVQCLFPMIVAMFCRQHFPRRMWWVEPRQFIHHNVVEDDLWHTTHNMLNLKYWQIYRMDFITFERLVDLLTPFLSPTAVTFVRPSIPVRKQVKLVLYRLAHGVSCARMHNLYGCDKSTIRKYTMIVCRVLGIGEDGLFFQFIHTLQGDRLQNIIESFRDITGLSNIASAIDGSHIPLNTRPNRRYTPMPSDFFNRIFFHNIVL